MMVNSLLSSRDNQLRNALGAGSTLRMLATSYVVGDKVQTPYFENYTMTCTTAGTTSTQSLTKSEISTAMTAGSLTDGTVVWSIERADKNYAKKITEMPTAGADWLGEIIQYTGVTTSTYTRGYFYECEEDTEHGGYKWTAIDVQHGGNNSFVPRLAAMPPSSEFNGKTVLYDSGDTEAYKKGHLYKRSNVQCWSVECGLVSEPVTLTLYSAEELDTVVKKKLFSDANLTIFSGYWADFSTVYDSVSEPLTIIGTVQNVTQHADIYKWLEVSPTQTVILSIFDMIYPIGSYAFGQHPTLGTWHEVTGDRAIWLKSGVADGTEITQSLPKPLITSTFEGTNAYTSSSGAHNHTFTGKSVTTSSSGTHTHTESYGQAWKEGSGGSSPAYRDKGNEKTFSCDEAGEHTHTITTSGTIDVTPAHNHKVTATGTVTSTVNTSGAYGTRAKVQPDAIVMTVWKRIA